MAFLDPMVVLFLIFCVTSMLVLTYISPIISDVAHIFIHLLAFVGLIWRKVYLGPLPIFYSIYLFFVTKLNSFYILGINPFQVYGLQMFSTTP